MDLKWMDTGIAGYSSTAAAPLRPRVLYGRTTTTPLLVSVTVSARRRRCTQAAALQSLSSTAGPSYGTAAAGSAAATARKLLPDPERPGRPGDRTAVAKY